MTEKILCAATWFDDGKKHNFQPKNIETGLVVMGFNHAMIFQTIGGSVKERQELGIHEREQGFVTTYQRFVDRKEALEIAKREGQIVKKYGLQSLLFSEDLFDFSDINNQPK